METETGTLQVAALSTKAVQDSGASVELNAGGSTVVRLPASVVSQAAKRSGPEGSNNSLLFVSITDIQAKVANKLTDARNEGELTAAVASQTVSVTLRREDGSAVDVGRLRETIEIEILVDDTNASCAFWDERQATWSFKGLRTIPADTPGRIICQTSHLTIFAGVLQSIWESSLQVIVCSSAGTLLTAEGFQRLFRSGWINSLPAISTLAFVALFLLVFCRALQVDWQTQKAVPWRVVEPVLLRVKETSEDDNSDDEVPAAHRARARCCQKLACMKDWCTWCAGICFDVENIVQVVRELLPNAPEATVNRCIKSLHAHRSGVAKDSLALILKPGEKFEVQDMGGVWRTKAVFYKTTITLRHVVFCLIHSSTSRDCCICSSWQLFLKAQIKKSISCWAKQAGCGNKGCKWRAHLYSRMARACRFLCSVMRARHKSCVHISCI